MLSLELPCNLPFIPEWLFFMLTVIAADCVSRIRVVCICMPISLTFLQMQQKKIQRNNFGLSSVVSCSGVTLKLLLHCVEIFYTQRKSYYIYIYFIHLHLSLCHCFFVSFSEGFVNLKQSFQRAMCRSVTLSFKDCHSHFF